MQGASALQGVLGKLDQPVEVFAVWEPVLPSDVLSPRTGTLARLSDPRVWQLWDPHHLLSDAMREGMRAHSSAIPIETRRRHDRAEGTLWDAVAVFPPGARWEQTLPAPSYLGGDVVDVTGALEAQLEHATPGP